MIEKAGGKYDASLDITAIQKKYDFLRYDYIGDCFQFYDGREKSQQQQESGKATFLSLMDQLYDHMYYEAVGPATDISVTGGLSFSAHGSLIPECITPQIPAVAH